MRHAKRGRKLGRTASHRRATLNNMATSLFMHGMIRTTKPKAKELRGFAERLITFAKRGDLHARRQVLRRIRNKEVVAKLFDVIAPMFAERQGGYTRVLNLGPRRGDATEVCVIELVGSELRSEFADTVSAGALASNTSITQDDEPVGEVEDSEAEDLNDAVTAPEEPGAAEDEKT